MHKICSTISFISCLYMFRAHVLIIRRSKLHYTASGIITPVGGHLVHLSIFISVFNKLGAQNLFHNKFYFMSLRVSSTCAHHQEVKIALHSIWYHHTYRWSSRAQNLFHNKFYFMSLRVSSTCAYHQEVKIVLHSLWYHHTYRTLLSQPVHETVTYRCDETRGCVMQFWPPDDEHMCSKHVETWNKTYCETNFVHQVR